MDVVVRTPADCRAMTSPREPYSGTMSARARARRYKPRGGGVVDVEHSIQAEKRVSWNGVGHYQDHIKRVEQKKAMHGHVTLGPAHWMGLTEGQMAAADCVGEAHFHDHNDKERHEIEEPEKAAQHTSR